MRRNLVLGLALLVSTHAVISASIHTSYAQVPRSTKKPPATTSAVTPAFKDAATRAVDAIQRVPATLSNRNLDQTTQVLLVDADKAVAEARYKAGLPNEISVVSALQRWLHNLRTQSLHEVLNPEWSAAAHRGLECYTKALYLLSAEKLSAEDLKAKASTCE